jgi:threonine dehydratase
VTTAGARVTAAGAEAARSRIDPVFLDSPHFPAEVLDEPLGCRAVVKIETLNPIRSFKGRGACSLVAQHDPAQPLGCASAGNLGQAMPWACRARGLPLVVFAAHAANPLKLDRMRALGTDVRLAGAHFDTAKLAAKAYAAERGACMVEDGATYRPSAKAPAPSPSSSRGADRRRMPSWSHSATARC